MANAIEFKLGADSRLLKTGLDTAKSQISSFKTQVGGILTGLFAGVGVDSLIKDFARVQDIADQFGITAESVQRVRGAAETAGTNVEFLAKQMAKVTIEANKLAQGGAGGIEIAGEGGSRAAQAFAKLGIAAENFVKLPLEEQILAISQGLEKIPDEGQRIAAAYDLFGAKGKEIIPLLLQGHQSLQEEFARTAVASDKMVAQIAAADDQLTRVSNDLKVFALSVVSVVDATVKGVTAMFTAGFVGVKTLNDSALVSIGKLTKGDFSGAGKSLVDGFKLAGKQIDEIAKGVSEQVSGGGSGSTSKKVTQDRVDAALNAADKAEDESFLARNAKAKQRAMSAFEERIQKAKDAAKKEADAKVKEEERAAERIADIEDQRMRAMFEQRQQSIGFASGGFSNTNGQQLAGVNYQVINSEAEKGIRLQTEMRDYLRSIDQKKWEVELPEAS